MPDLNAITALRCPSVAGLLTAASVFLGVLPKTGPAQRHTGRHIGRRGESGAGDDGGGTPASPATDGHLSAVSGMAG